MDVSFDFCNEFGPFMTFRIIFFCRKLFKSPKKKSRRSEIPDSPSSEYSPDEVINEFPSDEDYKFPRPGSRNSTLASCISSGLGLLVSSIFNCLFCIDSLC